MHMSVFLGFQNLTTARQACCSTGIISSHAVRSRTDKLSSCSTSCDDRPSCCSSSNLLEHHTCLDCFLVTALLLCRASAGALDIMLLHALAPRARPLPSCLAAWASSTPLQTLLGSCLACPESPSALHREEKCEIMTDTAVSTVAVFMSFVTCLALLTFSRGLMTTLYWVPDKHCATTEHRAHNSHSWQRFCRRRDQHDAAGMLQLCCKSGPSLNRRRILGLHNPTRKAHLVVSGLAAASLGLRRCLRCCLVVLAIDADLS